MVEHSSLLAVKQEPSKRREIQAEAREAPARP